MPPAPEPFPPPDLAPPSAAATRWRWLSGRLALPLCLAAVLGSLWVVHRRGQEEARAQLVRDVLWVEQNLQLALDRDLEHLRSVAHDSVGSDLDPRQLAMRVNHLLAESPSLVRVALLDHEGALRASSPAPPPADRTGRWLTPDTEPAYRLACATGKPSYGPPRPAAGDQHVEVFVPYYRAGAHAGTVVGVYSLRAMLGAIVPWWLAEKHRVTLRDAGGAVLAANSAVQPDAGPALTQQAVLEPPGHGLVLHLESYRTPAALLRNVLALTIVGLALTVLWTIVALRRHVKLRLATERALREEHAFRKAMEDSLETGIRAVDLEGRIVYVNRAFCKMVDYREDELVGHGAPQPYWPPGEHEHLTALLAAARRPGAPRAGVEMELMRRDGRRFDALVFEAPLVDAHGGQTGWMGSILDITERKQARERARQQQEKLAATARLVTMGEMASAIAHELNQPLSAIASYSTGCLNVLAAGVADAAAIRGALEKTARQAERAGRIIRRVHEFVRKSEPARARVRINRVVDEAVGFADPEARQRRVRIVPSLTADDPELDADPVLLQQVLLNLLRNGMDAMAGTAPGERTLTVATRKDDAMVTVSVADRGCGIPPDVREQLFEPFFTTKPEGMGMGLHICRSILELHRGRVWAEARPGGGSVFSFSLPAADA